MEFQQVLSAGAVDFVQPSPAKMGGISELQKVFSLAAANVTVVMVHSFYDGPGLLASVHASAALGSKDSLVEWRRLLLFGKVDRATMLPQKRMNAHLHGPLVVLDPAPPRVGQLSIL